MSLIVHPQGLCESDTVGEVPFTVSGRPAAVGGGNNGLGLPRTGSDQLVPLTITGVVLVGIGASIVVASRRRREVSMPGGLA